MGYRWVGRAPQNSPLHGEPLRPEEDFTAVSALSLICFFSSSVILPSAWPL